MNNKPLKHRRSLRGDEVCPIELAKRAANYGAAGYPKTKWMEFCEEMLAKGFRVFVYAASRTVSKYVTVLNPRTGAKFRVRFSNHPPAIHLEDEGNCDFFVGINNKSTATTCMAVKAALEALGLVDAPSRAEYLRAELVGSLQGEAVA